MVFLVTSETFRRIFVVAGIVFFALFIWLWNLSEESDAEALKQQQQQTLQAWNGLKAGDSIFVAPNLKITNFYKKGREAFGEYQQKKLNYRQNDTLKFWLINSVQEKFYYQNKSSLIGICLGKDSTQTDEGATNNYRWIMVKPNAKLSSLQNTNEFNYSTEKWKNKTGISRIDNT